MTSLAIDPMFTQAEKVGSTVTPLLRLEGAVALVASLVAYRWLGASWSLYALLFLAPDIFMLGYLRNPRLGALVYNTGHTYLAPATGAALSLMSGWSAGFAVALIWVGHVGFDRLMGYGLKHPDAFGHTHLSGAGMPPAPLAGRS